MYPDKNHLIGFGGVLLLLLPLVCLPAAAETSAPFYAYYVLVNGPDLGSMGGGSYMSPMVSATPRLLRRHGGKPGHKDAITFPGYVSNCYSDDGTIPDFAAGALGGLFDGLSSCSVGSSFSDAISVNNGANPAAVGTGNISGSIATISYTLTPTPEQYTPYGEFAEVYSEYFYVQVFDSPVPPGSQLSFKYTFQGNMPASVGVFSDCSDPSCSAYAGTAPPYTNTGLQTATIGPVTIGPSGTYTVTAGMGLAINAEESAAYIAPGPYTATINMACALQAIPAPSSGQIPALGFSGNNWSLNYGIGSNDGLEIKNVKFGNRSMAAQMSVPYFNITTTDFTGNTCLLQADGDGDCATKLVYFQSGLNDVTAIYVATNIPSGTSSCMAITENFEFDPPVPGDSCEPSGNVGCARFYPTVSYDYLPDDDSKSVTEVDLPMRIQFTAGNPASTLLTTNQGQSAAIAQDNNVTGIETFLLGNPVQKEIYVPNVINQGSTGNYDSFYQTYLPAIDAQSAALPSPTPDCATCAQIHWRWPSIFSGVPGFNDDNGGNPRIPDGSNQSVDVAIVAYPDNQMVDCSNLASGHQITGLPTVFWYCGKGYQDSDSFFQHGAFFNPVAGTTTNPAMTVTKSGFRINHANGQWGQTVTLTNNNNYAIAGPVALLLDSLPADVTLANADGLTQFVTPKGTPYVFTALDQATQLSPGQSLTVTLEFANPKNAAITYSTQIYAGGVL
jgi:hypothetical protein